MVLKLLAAGSRGWAGLVCLLVLLCGCGTNTAAAPLTVHATSASAPRHPSPAPALGLPRPVLAPSAPRSAGATAGAPAGSERWTPLLQGLNRTRARALQQLRPALLGRVYVRGSSLLRRERAVLTSYRDRDVRLLGARLHIGSARVVSRSRNQVALRVVETLGPTTAVLERGHRVLLPADAPTRRALRLVRTSAGWRIAAARRLAG